MKRFIVLGMNMIVGAVLGCSGGGIADGQPKNANPNAEPKVKRATINPGGGVGAGGAAKAAPSPTLKE